MPGTVNEQNLVDYFKKRKLSYRPVVIENLVELEQAFYAGRCDVSCRTRPRWPPAAPPARAIRMTS